MSGLGRGDRPDRMVERIGVGTCLDERRVVCRGFVLSRADLGTGSRPVPKPARPPGARLAGELSSDSGSRSALRAGRAFLLCCAPDARQSYPRSGGSRRYRAEIRDPRSAAREDLASRTGAAIWPNGAARESNLPSRGLHDLTGFEDRPRTVRGVRLRSPCPLPSGLGHARCALEYVALRAVPASPGRQPVDGTKRAHARGPPAPGTAVC